MSKSMTNRTRFPPPKNCWRSSIWTAGSSRSTPCTVKKTFEAAKEAKAHLIVQIKDNQPALHEKTQRIAATEQPLDTATATDRGHNRSETRTVAVFDACNAVAGSKWEDLVASIIQVTRTTHKRNSKTGPWDTTASTAYYLPSRPASASILAEAIRAHWGIENRSHYPRDVAFDEDASRIRVNPGIFARLRSFAFNILRINEAGSFVQNRYRAALSGVEGLLQLTVS